MKMIDLHCHLDGSLRPKTVIELLEALGEGADVFPRFGDVEEIKHYLAAPVPCLSLAMYLRCFDLPIAVLQTAEALERVAYELMEDAANEGVVYLEMRFAPHQHTSTGLSLEAVIEAVLSGIERAEAAFEIKGRLILSHMRHTSTEALMALIEAGKGYLNRGVVAMDLCGGEKLGDAKPFETAYQYAKSLGYHITIHAGETGHVENIIDAVMLLGAERIGHGTALAGHEAWIDKLKALGVALECCPTSNLQTKAVSMMALHPIKHFLECGLRTTLNTDNRTVSQTDMQSEWHGVKEAFDWHEAEYRLISEHSIEAVFAEDEVKKWLRKKLEL